MYLKYPKLIHYFLQGVVSGSVEPHEIVVSRLQFEAVDDNFTTSVKPLQATSSKYRTNIIN